MNLDHLSITLSSLGPALKNHLWQSTVFSVLAWVIALCMQKNHARVRYWIWLAASIKFLIPFSILVTLGSTLGVSRKPAATETTVHNLMYRVSQPFASTGMSNPAGPAIGAISLHGLTWHQMYPILLTTIWVIGFSTVLAVWATYWRRVSHAIHAATTAVEGPELSMLQCLQRSGIGNTPIRLVLTDTTLGPGIYGITRPILIWPSRVLRRLDETEIKSILAHEIGHVRHRDNLTAAIHMFVEAIFWFHPLVWWLGSRLELERERACDELVLELTGAPQAYAESILKVCELCLEFPLPCVSGVTGADLKKRIVRIMTDRVAHKLTRGRKAILAVVGIISLTVPVVVGVLWAEPSQTEGVGVEVKNPKFAVVSIRQDKAGGQQVFGKTTPDGWQMRNMFLMAPISIAYVPLTGGATSYADDQIIGMPTWLVSDDDKYDIDAKIEEADLADWQNPNKQPAMLRAMLQVMLTERMNVKVHRSSKEAPVYALVVGNKGPRFKETDPNASHPGAYPMPGGGMLSMEMKEGLVTTHYFGISIGQLVSYLLGEAGRPVQDKTGLTGKYDMTIVKPAPAGVGTPNVGPPPEMSAAEIADQLGLKLKTSEGQVETLVIDHVERPTPN
jgi:bla regulator protein blaR1